MDLKTEAVDALDTLKDKEVYDSLTPGGKPGISHNYQMMRGDIHHSNNNQYICRRLKEEGDRLMFGGEEAAAIYLYRLLVDFYDETGQVLVEISCSVPERRQQGPINLRSDQGRSIEDSFSLIIPPVERDTEGRVIR